MDQTFVILEERADGGLSYVRDDGNSSMMCMVVSFPSFEQDRFPGRGAAAANVKVLQAKNARGVEATTRRRKYKTLSATYTVTSVKKMPAGMRPRSGQMQIIDGACLAHDAGFFKATSAIPHSSAGDGDREHPHIQSL